MTKVINTGYPKMFTAPVLDAILSVVRLKLTCEMSEVIQGQKSLRPGRQARLRVTKCHCPDNLPRALRAQAVARVELFRASAGSYLLCSICETRVRPELK